jgi:hypothetical protein
LWRNAGASNWESSGLLLGHAGQGRDLLGLLDQLNPTTAELSQAIDHEVTMS